MVKPADGARPGEREPVDVERRAGGEMVEAAQVRSGAPEDGLPVLLLTGFEPFGKLPVNPAWELARAFDGEIVERVHVCGAQLPVVWDEAWPALAGLIERLRPAWIVMMGLSETRKAVSVELRARNKASPVADNRGRLPERESVQPDGPEFMVSSLPATLLVERFDLAGVPAEVSSDAGAYLCNWTLYHALAHARQHPEVDGVGFIHVPPLPDQGGPGISLDDLKRGLRSALAGLVAGKVPSVEELAALSQE